MAYSGTPFIAVPYSSSVNPMELFYANTMAIRGLGTVCTYKDIKEGNKLRDEIDYFCRYSREIGDQIIEKTKFYLKNDGSELAAKSIANSGSQQPVLRSETAVMHYLTADRQEGFMPRKALDMSSI